ncbi:MAG: hypothetical protein AAF772_03945, partial [Acidobacteriota bacterium]
GRRSPGDADAGATTAATVTAAATPQPAARPAQAAASSPRRTSPLRLLVVTALALVLGGALGFGVYAFATRGPEVVDRLSPEAEQMREWLPLVREGQRRMQENRPNEALQAFERALSLVPNNRSIRRLRDEAETALLAEKEGLSPREVEIRRRVQAAQDALNARDYATAIERAQQVFEIDSRNRRAQRIVREAEAGQDRRSSVGARLAGAGRRGPGDSTAPTTANPPPAAAPTAGDAGTVPLSVIFRSALPSGLLTIYADHDLTTPILKEAFDFSRLPAGGGTMTATLALPPGPVELTIYLWRPDAQTVNHRVRGRMNAGLPDAESATLDIRLLKTGSVDAALR